MSALGNGTVPYSPSAPGFILSANAANGTGGMTHSYESNQMGYVNAHPIQSVTSGGKRSRGKRSRGKRSRGKRSRRRKSRRTKCSIKSSKKSRRRRK